MVTRDFTEFPILFHNFPAIVVDFDYTLFNKGKDRSGSTPYANKRNRKRKNKHKRK